VIGISSRRCSSVEALSEMANFGRISARPNPDICGTIPEVETVILRCDMPIPLGSTSSRVAFRTWSRFNSGSPIPIITTFSREPVGLRPFSREMCRT
jgi:hypothetical protein